MPSIKQSKIDLRHIPLTTILASVFLISFMCATTTARPCTGIACTHTNQSKKCETLAHCKGLDCSIAQTCAFDNVGTVQSAQVEIEDRRSEGVRPTLVTPGAGFSFYEIGLPPILLKWQVLIFLFGLGLAATRMLPAIVVLALTALTVGLFAHWKVLLLDKIGYWIFLDQIGHWSFLVGSASLVISGLTLLSPASVRNLTVTVASFLLGCACGVMSAPYWTETPTLLGTALTSTLIILIPFTLGATLAQIFKGKVFAVVSRIIGSWLAAAGIMLAALVLSPA